MARPVCPAIQAKARRLVQSRNPLAFRAKRAVPLGTHPARRSSEVGCLVRPGNRLAVAGPGRRVGLGRRHPGRGRPGPYRRRSDRLESRNGGQSASIDRDHPTVPSGSGLGAGAIRPPLDRGVRATPTPRRNHRGQRDYVGKPRPSCVRDDVHDASVARASPRRSVHRLSCLRWTAESRVQGRDLDAREHHARAPRGDGGMDRWPPGRHQGWRIQRDLGATPRRRCPGTALLDRERVQ